MRINYKNLVIVFVLFSVALFAQKSRTAAMGGLSFSVRDIDESFDPYALGGNTAWLINSQSKERLEVTPMQKSDYGTYHRKYIPERINNFGTHFLDIKPLGTSGTFLGEAAYNYQERIKNYRNLKYAPYAGEGFFFTDTTTGNTTYNGPMFRLSHSFQLYNNIFIGGGVKYQILNGLKDVYTFGETVYRNVEGNFGVAYQLNNGMVLGLSVKGADSQERIEASDVNLLTVRTYEWRGETHAIELRGSSQNYKINKSGKVFSGQFYYSFDKRIELGIAADYEINGSSFLFPEGSLVDVEDGYASFKNIDVKARGRYQVSKDILTALSFNYFNCQSWSENSKRGLMIWDWKNKGVSVGAGASLNLSDNLLIGFEYETEYVLSDSSKYIDNRFSNYDVINNIARIGLEYYLSNTLALRAGYNFAFLSHDFLFGKDDVSENLATVGFGYSVNSDIQLDGLIRFAQKTTDNPELYRSYFDWLLTLRFFTF